MGDFADSISHSDSLQLIGVIANCSGILSSALGVISFVQSEEEPDNAELLDKIDQLQQTIDTDFAKLGDLIQQQTQIIVDTVNRDGMALALSRSDVATARIQTFLANGDNNALETAETESIAGVQFFNELGLSSYADMLFFLPGLVKAGSVRIFVIASEPLRVREPKNVIVDSIGSMVTLLANMIETIKSTVDAAHTVNEKSHTARCPVHQPIHGSAPVREVTVIDGYYHEERGQILAFFDAQQGAAECEQPSGHEAEALAAAKNQSHDRGAVGLALTLLDVVETSTLHRDALRVKTSGLMRSGWFRHNGSIHFDFGPSRVIGPVDYIRQLKFAGKGIDVWEADLDVGAINNHASSRWPPIRRHIN